MPVGPRVSKSPAEGELHGHPVDAPSPSSHKPRPVYLGFRPSGSGRKDPEQPQPVLPAREGVRCPLRITCRRACAHRRPVMLEGAQVSGCALGCGDTRGVQGRKAEGRERRQRKRFPADSRGPILLPGGRSGNCRISKFNILSKFS